MHPLAITADNFEAEVLKSPVPVLIDFWAGWCAPCRMLAPTIDALAESESSIKVGKVNVDEQPELAERFKVMGIPTLMIFKDGQAVHKSTGVLSKEKLLTLMEH